MFSNIKIYLPFLLVLIGIGAYIYRDSLGLSVSSSQQGNIATTTINGQEVSVEGPAGAKFELIPIKDLPKAPSFNFNPTFTAGTSDDVKKLILEKISQNIEILKKDGTNINAWLTLGNLYKFAGDYEDARKMWEYASALSPTNIVSFANLGDLYHYYLKNYPKAEQNLLMAIKNSAGQNNAAHYKNLYDLYKLSYIEKASQIPKILEEGIKANPDSEELKNLLSQYNSGNVQ